MPVKPNTPITRKEMYLDVMTGGSSSLPEPIPLEEMYLAKIAGMAVDLPTPRYIKHKYLAKIAGMTVNVPTYTMNLPRIYAYLAKAAGQDIEVPQPITREEMYWFDYVNGQPTPSEQEYTGAVPVTFTANGQPLLDYLISGNEEHSGTPTPGSPIIPQGTGDLETSGEKAGQYKIPISSANTTTPVYLGEVESTRKIRRLVLTGEEAWDKISGNAPYRIELPNIVRTSDKDIVLFTSSHYRAVSNNAFWDRYTTCVSWTFSNGVNGKCLVFRDTNQATLADFKTYLAQQYSAGTPVTVWYVLSTEQTGIVNEPLRKIGDYADSISKAQAGAEIPTVNGSNTLDVLSTVKPSEVYIKYKGEPVAGSQVSLQSSAYAPAEVSGQSESVDDINNSLLGKEEETK